MGLNVWILNRLTDDRNMAYNAIVNDLLQEDSVLKKAIEIILIGFRSIADKFLTKQSERNKQEKILAIPLEEDWFTEDYEDVKTVKSALTPFYQLKKVSSVEKDSVEKDSVEKDFVKYLEQKEKIQWWYKSGDKGAKYFSIPYNNNKNLFYPDWFVKLADGRILILDTKMGWTAKDAKDRIEGLHKFLKDEKLTNCIGGIVVKHSGSWKVNTKEIYKYDENCSEFSYLDDLIDTKKQ